MHSRTRSKICKFFTLKYTPATPGVILWCSIGFFISSSLVLAWNVPVDSVRLDDIETYQLLGGYLGGTFGVVVAALAVWVLYDSFTLQKKEFGNMFNIAKQTAELNKQSLSHQKEMSEREEQQQRRTFLLREVNGQLDRVREELKSPHRMVHESGKFSAFEPGEYKSISTKDIFSNHPAEARVANLAQYFNSNVIKQFISHLSFYGHDTIKYLRLGGMYHHRANQFDELMALLEPFRRRCSEIIELLAPLNISSDEFWILAHTHEKIAELRHMQEFEIKQELISKTAGDLA